LPTRPRNRHSEEASAEGTDQTKGQVRDVSLTCVTCGREERFLALRAMPHALLLSPDDQAVSAITGVLDEMSVTCERPLDGPSAAKKLNSQSYDLVLVDCENLPAAKLIFDVCRRPNAGVSPVPIAIVDGRAGLPTAFRLGAELILTKPVAKDQARTTIRTAVNRIKKDEAPHPPHPTEEVAAEKPAPPAPEPRTHAAAAGASLFAAKPVDIKTQVAKPEPEVEAPQPPVAQMQSVVEPVAKPAVSSKPLPELARDLTPPQSFASPKLSPPAPAPRPKPIDDPVLADLESDLPTPALASHRAPKPKKGRGSIWFLLFVMLAGGGFYAAWMYQPGFREMVRPWLDRAIAALHVPGQSQVQAPPPRTGASVPSPATPIEKAASATDSVVSPSPAPAATSSGDTSTSDRISTTPAGTTSAAETPASSETSTARSETEDLGSSLADDSTSDARKNEFKNKASASALADAELPGEKTAVILSSQGAEKRLLHRVPPAYPTEARKQRVEGTVVLKAVVNDSGKVAGVRVVEGNPALAAAAISAVKQWRYRPYLRNGRAMPFQTVVLVDFQRH
jgi:TonB family protein